MITIEYLESSLKYRRRSIRNYPENLKRALCGKYGCGSCNFQALCDRALIVIKRERKELVDEIYDGKRNQKRV